jgi:hypothetical protein
LESIADELNYSYAQTKRLHRLFTTSFWTWKKDEPQWAWMSLEKMLVW